MPRRVYRFLLRIFNEKVLKLPPITQRNWELQFIGEKNNINLKHWLFKNKLLNDIVPSRLVNQLYRIF